jgi:hypothetical protein
MPPKLQVSKIHQILTIRTILLVKFGVFVIWWQNPTSRSGPSFEISDLGILILNLRFEEVGRPKLEDREY